MKEIAVFRPFRDLRFVIPTILVSALVISVALLLVSGQHVAYAQESNATGTPTIGGTVEVGETLTADTSGIEDPDGLDDVSFSYQWIRSDDTTDSDIEGATSSTYTIIATDVDRAIKLRVRFTDDEGNDETLTSAATVAVPIEVTLTFKLEGTTVTCDSYNVSTVNIPYKECDDPTSTEEGTSGEIEVEVEIARSTSDQLYKFDFSIWQMQDGFGDKGVEANDLCLGSGLDEIVSLEVTADDDTDTFTFGGKATIFELCPAGTYQLFVPWFRYSYTEEEYEHAGTFRRYFFITADGEEDTSIERVRYVFPLNPDPPASHGDVLISGTWESRVINRDLRALSLAIGGLVHDSNATTTDYVVSLRVLDGNGREVPWCHVGDVGYSHLLKTVPEDGEWTMNVHVLGGCVSHWFPETLRVELLNGSSEHIAEKDIALLPPSNTPATGAPTITGRVQLGQTLTADTSGIADADGMASSTFAYQWLSSRDTEIEGATSSTYTLQASDAGKVIKVRVTFTDDEGNEESLTSEATSAVSAISLSGITSTEYTENGTTTVATYTATGGKQGVAVTWTLTGEDSDDFSISSSGALTFSSPPDHESASDSDTNNVYEVTVNASDGTNTAMLDVTVTVTDQVESPIGGL